MTDREEQQKSSREQFPMLKVVKNHQKQPEETDKEHKIHTDWATKWAKSLIKDKDDYMLLIMDNLLTDINKSLHEGIDTSKFVY